MGKGFRTCEVCGLKERHAGDKSLLFSKFPLEASRCREWLKAVGNEELVHLPIEKLHDQRNVCANHFRRKDFNKKGNRLKRHAFPSLRLTAARLTDAQLAEFPLHVGMDKRGTLKRNTAHNDHNYSAQDSATQISENSVTIKTCDLISTSDDVQLTNDQLVFDANAPENEYLNKDGFNDNDFDDDGPHPAAPEPEEVPPAIFSWQKETDSLQTEIIDDDKDSIICPSVGETVDLLDPDFSMYRDDEPKPAKSKPEPIKSPDQPAEYQCNECQQHIVGFRYTCVQCADWDLCSSCEARTAHATHYVLRVPSPKPYNEIQAVLSAIRRQLLSENLFLNQAYDDDSLKLEVKDEPHEEPPLAAPEPSVGADPLSRDSDSPGRDSDSDCYGDNTQAEDSSEESDASSSPHHKRPPHQSPQSAETHGHSIIITSENPVVAVQENHATIADQIDLTETLSDNATNIPTSERTDNPRRTFKLTRMIAPGNPAHKLAPVSPNIFLVSKNSPQTTIDMQAITRGKLSKSLGQEMSVKVTARNSISFHKPRRERSTNPTSLIAEKIYTGILNNEKPTKATRILASNRSISKVVQDFLTKKVSSDDTRKLAEAIPSIPHRTAPPTDDVICLDDTPKITSIEKLNTVERNIDPPETNKVPDRVDCSSGSPSQLPDNELVLRVPSDTNEVDLVRALQSKVTVRMERLQVEVVDFIPAKKRRLK